MEIMSEHPLIKRVNYYLASENRNRVKSPEDKQQTLLDKKQCGYILNLLYFLVKMLYMYLYFIACHYLILTHTQTQLSCKLLQFLGNCANLLSKNIIWLIPSIPKNMVFSVSHALSHHL